MTDSEARLTEAWRNAIAEPIGEHQIDGIGMVQVGVKPMSAILAADPPLAQDIADGAALRRLREALPSGLGIIISEGPYRSQSATFGVDAFGVALVPMYTYNEGIYRGGGSSIAEAADSCRETLTKD